MSGLTVMQRLSPKRIPVDKIGEAETRLSELMARAASAAERRADAANRFSEAKAALDAAAESGADLAPIARKVLEAEAEMKAIDLEAGPLAAAVDRAAKSLADLREERRLALMDDQLEWVGPEFEKSKAQAADAVRVLAEKIERAYGLDRLRSALLQERNGKQDFGSKALYEDGHWRLFLEEASKERPFEPAPEDVGKTAGSWTLRLEVFLRDPQAVMRAIKAARKAA